MSNAIPLKYLAGYPEHLLLQVRQLIEQGKLAVIKSISRTPKITHEVIELGERARRTAPGAGDGLRRQTAGILIVVLGELDREEDDAKRGGSG